MPPPVPIFEMMWRIMSFEHTPGRNFPSTFMRMLFGFDCRMHCEARAISTSLVPIPKATHPKAPWVEVWLSPQTMVMPGCVSPVSGPTTWIMPLRGDPIGKMVMLLSAQLAYSAATCAADCGSAIGRGGAGGGSHNAAKKVKGAKIVTFNTAGEAILDLSIGGSDAVINDRPVTAYIMTQQPKLGAQLVHQPETYSADDFAFVFRKDQSALKDEVNAALAKLKSNGEYDKIYNKWFGKN